MTRIFYEVVNQTALGSTKMVNVMHFEKVAGGAATVSDINALLGAIRTSFYNQWSSFYPSPLQWNVGQKVTELDLDDPTASTFIPATAVLSTVGTGTSLPGQLAVCVRWITPLHTRRGRGRTFCGPISSSALSGPALSSTAQAAFNTAAGLLPGSGAGVGGLTPAWQMVIFSKITPRTLSIVTTGNTDGVVDTLRSRKY
jgi:hypothetical protein